MNKKNIFTVCLTVFVIMCTSMRLSAATYTVGQYLSDADGAGTPGVVFYTNSAGTGAWVMALNDVTNIRWSTEFTLLTGVDANTSNSLVAYNIAAENGYGNTLAMRSAGTATVYPAAYAVEVEHGWYLPSILQLYVMAGASEKVEQAITDHGGMWLSTASNVVYYSSTQHNNTYAKVLTTETNTITYKKKDTVAKLRACITVGDFYKLPNVRYHWNTGATDAVVEVPAPITEDSARYSVLVDFSSNLCTDSDRIWLMNYGYIFEHDGSWHTASNWKESRIPNFTHSASIRAKATVTASAAVKNMNFTASGSVTVKPTGNLNAYGTVSNTDAAKIKIESTAAGTGTFTFAGTAPYATVQMYSRAANVRVSPDTLYTWQYFGVPITKETSIAAEHQFTYAFVCYWDETQLSDKEELGSQWRYVLNPDTVQPYRGYAITQNIARTYTFFGQLNNKDTTWMLTRTSGSGMNYKGYHLLANPFTAPIDLTTFVADDFHRFYQTIYIFNTGSKADWNNSTTNTDGTGSQTGQYLALPINTTAAGLGLTALKVIPAMQGFFVQTKSSTPDYYGLRLRYNVNVNRALQNNAPMRVRVQAEDSINTLTLWVKGVNTNLSDGMRFLQHETFNQTFDDGWDGEKMEGVGGVPTLYAITPDGNMSICATNVINGMYLGFVVGMDADYVFSFGDDCTGDYYLYDTYTGTETSICQGNSYAFTADGSEPVERFVIYARTPAVPTSVDKVIDDVTDVAVYDMLGRLIFQKQHVSKVDERRLLLQSGLPKGVYMVKTNRETIRVVVR